MELSMNDVDIIFVNRDFAFYLSLVIVVFAAFKISKRFFPSLSTQSGFIYKVTNFIGISLWELLAVLIIRGFFYEMYLIPSGSMQPSLYPGDLILVNKYAFGFKVPGTNMMLKSISNPMHGDVVVFLEPQQPTKRKMIKRVIGLPGDHIQFHGDELFINDQLVPQNFLYKSFEYIALPQDKKIRVDTYFYQQSLGAHNVVIEAIPALHQHFDFDFIVPHGHYFVMGDNRDNSQDSRYWGFVPERFLCGKAQLVLFSFGSKEKSFNLERMGAIV